MFRWVYDLTNNSQLSWLNVLYNGKSVPYRNTGEFSASIPVATRSPVTPRLTDLARQGDVSEGREN
jgi:hypothetical protein